MPELILPAALKHFERECTKIGKKVGNSIEPENVGDKIEDAATKGLCNEIKSVDKTVVEFLADELKKNLDTKKPKDPNAVDTKAKFEIKVWADPGDFETKDKGVLVNFTVVNW